MAIVWRRIEDGAPKDGTPIDVWDGKRRITDVFWGKSDSLLLTEKRTGWVCLDDEGFAQRVAPTHWMPIPAPPDAEAS